eukprot:8237-Heterococcus_DN1.PRE.1
MADESAASSSAAAPLSTIPERRQSSVADSDIVNSTISRQPSPAGSVRSQQQASDATEGSSSSAYRRPPRRMSS